MSERVSFWQWYRAWKANRQTERLGQAFINDFIRESWIELYNETDEEVAMNKIFDWLRFHCYHDERGYYVPKEMPKWTF